MATTEVSPPVSLRLHAGRAALVIFLMLPVLSGSAYGQANRSGVDDSRAGTGSNTPDDNSLFKRRFNVVDDRELRGRPEGPTGGVGEASDDNTVDEPLYEEFSRYIRETTGKNVEDAMPIKRSLAKAPKLPDSYIVGRGDQVEIQVWGSVNSQYRLTVDDSGRIFVPEVGSVPVAGVKSGELTSVLTNSFRRIYKGFDLRAVVGIARGVSINVNGQAASLGLKYVSATHTLLSATLTFARPAPGGSRRFIEFRRGTQAAQRIDLYCFVRAECPALPETLQDGDTIHVPMRGKLVAISGGVPRPGIYELAPGETLHDLLNYAGGLSVIADPSRIYAYSFGGPTSGQRLLQTTGLEVLCRKVLEPSSAQCREPADGDYFDFQPRIATVDGTITVAVPGVDPIKVEFKPGMRLLDVIRAPFDSLVPSRALRGINSGAYSALADLDEKLRRLDLDALTLYRLDRDKREYTPTTVSHRAAAAAPGTDANLTLQSGDVLVIEDISEWKMRRDDMPMSVRILGEVAKPGRYRYEGAKKLGEVLQMAGGTTPNAALWSAVVLRVGDGRNAVNREMLDRALKAITDHQLRQEQTNTDNKASVVQLKADRPVATGTVQTLNSRTQGEVAELLKGRDVIYLSDREGLPAGQLTLAPNDVVIIPPQQDTFACQGAFFRSGEFLVGNGTLDLKEAANRCGLIEEMSPNLYHFVARENRICRTGWFRSCPSVQGGDMLVAVPEVVTRRGMAAVMDWLDVTLKSLASIATVKVLSK